MASERLPKYLLGPNGASYDAAETPWQEAMGTRKPKWDWLAERVDPSQISNDGVGYPGVPDVSSWAHLKQDANGKVSRPELENFGPAMIGAGKVSGAAHPFGRTPLEHLSMRDTVPSNTFYRLFMGRFASWRNRCRCRRRSG